MSIVGGGVIPIFQGLLSDASGGNMQLAYSVPLLCFIVIVMYAVKCMRQPAILGSAGLRITRPRLSRSFFRHKRLPTKPDLVTPTEHTNTAVIPAKAGTQFCHRLWAPACAGVTEG